MQENRALFIHPQGRYFSKFFLFLGTAIIVAAGVFAILDILWPLVFIPLGLLFFIPTQQFEVDLEQKKCRDCTKFLNIKFGEWHSLDKAQYIALKKQNYAFLRSSGLMAMDSKEEIESAYEVSFVISPKEVVEIDEFRNKELAKNIATALSTKLGIPVIDLNKAKPA